MNIPSLNGAFGSTDPQLSLTKLMRRHSLSLLALSLALSQGGCSKGSFNWVSSLATASSATSSSLQLAFLSPFNSSQTIANGNSITSIQVEVLNSSSSLVTSGSYTVSLATYSDSACTQATSSCNSIGLPTATQSGIASVSTNGGSCQGNPPSGTPFYLKATASGVTSACSASLTVGSFGSSGSTSTTTMNMMVPIEMMDYGVSGISASPTPTTTISHSSTYLDPNYYSGTVTYTLEIVAALSAPLATATVTLMNNGSSIASINIPLYTTSETLLVSSSFTPGNASYPYYLTATPSGGTLTLYTARIKVTQTGASQTQVSIPMISGAEGGQTAASNYDDSSGAAPFYANSSSYTTVSSNSVYSSTIWTYGPNYYNNNFNGTTPILLDALVSTQSTNTCWVTLYDTTPGQSGPVSPSSSQSVASATSPTRAYAYFSSSSLTQGHTYQVAVKSSDGTNNCYLYKANLRIAFNSFSSSTTLEIYNRVSKYESFASNYLNPPGVDFERFQYNPSNYSYPSLYFEWDDTLNIVNYGEFYLVDFGSTPSGNTSVGSFTELLTAFYYSGSTGQASPSSTRTSFSTTGNSGDYLGVLGIENAGMFTIIGAFVIVTVSAT